MLYALNFKNNKQGGLMEHRKQYYKNFIVVLLLMFVMLTTFCIFGQVANKVFAETPNNTSVLADLQKDSNFKVTDYRDKADDYSIDIIQIAESTAKELLIYTYQPCQRTCYLVATCINMSLSDKVTGTNLHNLELISQEGVFCKYRVKNLVVANTNLRYYNITSIYRAWNDSIDKPSGNNNTINEVAYNVGKLFKAENFEGSIRYSYELKETIEILNPYTGFLQYSDGFFLYLKSCRSHYIAFNTDKQIDYLLEADVSFTHQSVKTAFGLGGTTEYGEPITEPRTLKGSEKGGNTADGWFSKKYEWQRIQSVDTFCNTEELNPEVEKDLKDKNLKWVLRFYESDYKYMSTGSHFDIEEYTKVTEVTILRLKFITGFKLYDLGAVSSKITGSNTEWDNTNPNESDFFGWLGRLFKKLAEKLGIPEWVLILIIVILVLAILMPILGLIFPPLGQILKLVLKGIIKALEWLIKAIIWIIVLPFKCIVLIVNKVKGGGSA